jgi:ankyrin repeat protein
MDIDKDEIFNLIKNKDFDKIYNLIKKKEITKFDIKDNNYNYLIQYFVNYNQLDIFSLILEMKCTIRIDILDSDGRNILYYCIKFNYIPLLKKIIEINKKNIGISIIDLQDRLGFTTLHYAIIFNNEDAFNILLDNSADPYIISKDESNAFILALMYKRNNIINILLDREYDINFTNKNGENLLQIATSYNNYEVIEKILKTIDKNKLNLNNISNDFGLTILHQSIILDIINLYTELLENKVKINIPDFYGNTALHYIFLEKREKYLSYIINNPELNSFNAPNINGEIPLHILLNSYNDWHLDKKTMDKIILESDLNIQDNTGTTCLMKMVENNMIKEFKDILVNKLLNFYIEDNKSHHIKINDDILDIMVTSFYNQIKQNKEELILDWEKWCSNDMFEKLKTLSITLDKNATSEKICREKIKSVIIKERRSLPKLSQLDLRLDNGIFTNVCYYTGNPIDILFGLYLLNNDFKNKNLSVILDYPLTINKSLEDYYKKINLDYPYKLDFSNIEIIWSYQKLFFPSYFNDEINKRLKTEKYKYIVIPIGIETGTGSHANILFWDVKNKTIERFEPNGSNYPMGMNYNPKLLDSLLDSKFRSYEPDLIYLQPYKFLPNISFQILENLESTKCKKIGDPNGFCGVWCIWWVYQRMLNIDNDKIKDPKNLASDIIKHIKFDNQSFKTIIRNFSNKITEVRDRFFKKYNIDINDWIVGNYSTEILNGIEKDILNKLL